MSKDIAVCIRDYAPMWDVLPNIPTLELAQDVTFGHNINLDASMICLD